MEEMEEMDNVTNEKRRGCHTHTMSLLILELLQI